jgi:hypothetical protein
MVLLKVLAGKSELSTRFCAGMLMDLATDGHRLNTDGHEHPSVQAPNFREIPNLNFQKQPPYADWSLRIGASLELGVWTLGA